MVSYYLNIDPKELYIFLLSHEELPNIEMFVDFPKEMMLSKYLISTFGNIYNKDKRCLIFSFFSHSKGYLRVNLKSDMGPRKMFYLHRLMADVFLAFDTRVKFKDKQRWNNHIMNFAYDPEHTFPGKENINLVKLIIQIFNFDNIIEEPKNENWEKVTYEGFELEISDKKRVKYQGEILTSFMYHRHKCVSLPGKPIVDVNTIYFLSDGIDAIEGLVSLLERKDFYIYFPLLNEVVDLSMENNSGNKRRVVQYKEGELIKTYPSIAEAAEKTGTDAKNIGRVCRKKRKTANGFTWKYLEES